MTKAPHDNVRVLITKGTRDALAAGALSVSAGISAAIAALPTVGGQIPGFDADLTAADFQTCRSWVSASIAALPVQPR